MDQVNEPSGQATHHSAVDTDVLEVVAGVLLDEPYGALGAEGTHAVLDEGGQPGVVMLDQLKGNIPDESHLSMIVAADVMDSTLLPVTTGMTLSEVAGRSWKKQRS